MTTALTLITKALQKNGVLTKGETPDADEANDALDVLNEMLGSWSNEDLMVASLTQETFPLTGGVASYTIGVGGDFNTSRPLFINKGSFVRSGTTDYPLKEISTENYNSMIVQKNVGGIPECLSYSNSHPLGVIKLYPVPSEGYTLYLLSEKPIAEFATLDTDIDLPAGWARAIIYSLAIELAAEYGQQVGEALYALALDAMGKIKRQITRNRTMDYAVMIGKRDNILAGY